MQYKSLSKIKKKSNLLFQVDYKFHHLCISERASIFEAMKVIEKGKERICFVIKENNELIRVISDGDIRRAFLKSKLPSDLAKDIHSRKPIISREDNIDKATSHLNKWLTIIPIVDIENKIIGLLRTHNFSSFQNIRQNSVMVIGLGYVGLTLSLILADNGFKVFGYDKDKKLVDSLLKINAPFYENGLENLLETHLNNHFIPKKSSKDLNAEIYIVTVGTPIFHKNKKPNVDHIKKAVELVAYKLKKNDLIILRSTVPVGCTRNVVIPLIENISGLKVGQDFYIAFCPERTAEGLALKELRELPQLVGGYDQNSREVAMKFFNENTHTVIDVGSLESAEMCKLLDNTYRDTCFAYANQMALITEKLGLNLKELVSKVNLGYERSKIPIPSPGVGGPCLSKDPYILQSNFSEYGIDCHVTSAARKINESAPKNIYERCSKILSAVDVNIKTSKILIIGFAFKGEPVTSDMRESTTLWFLEYLQKKGIKNICGYDPIVNDIEIKKLGVKPCSLDNGFNNSTAVFIMNNHRSYSDMNINKLLGKMKKPGLFFDGWNMFNSQEIQNVSGIVYASIGSG